MPFDNEKNVVIKDFGHINVDGATQLQVKLVSYNGGETKLDLQKFTELKNGEFIPARGKRIETHIVSDLVTKLQEVEKYLKVETKPKEKKGK